MWKKVHCGLRTPQGIILHICKRVYLKTSCQHDWKADVTEYSVMSGCNSYRGSLWGTSLDSCRLRMGDNDHIPVQHCSPSLRAHLRKWWGMHGIVCQGRRVGVGGVGGCSSLKVEPRTPSSEAGGWGLQLYSCYTFEFTDALGYESLWLLLPRFWSICCLDLWMGRLGPRWAELALSSYKCKQKWPWGLVCSSIFKASLHCETENLLDVHS